MIVYYAIGGGLGHATRARRVLDALGLDATIVTSADVPRALEDDVDAHRDWIRSLGATRLIVDSFPLGIHGELVGMEIDHVARLLRWDEYRRCVPDPLPHIGTTFIVESLAPEHDCAIREASERVVELPLRAEVAEAHVDAPFSIVVHSGPAEEVQELVRYAMELRDAAATHEPIVVATRCGVALPDGVARTDTEPPAALFAAATRIVSAAGFNTMLETEPWREKHHVMPFARRFDDQFARAARRRGTARG